MCVGFIGHWRDIIKLMEPFKNLFSPELVRCIGQHLQFHLPDFEREAFEGDILAQLEKLELKERSQLIADHIHVVLPTANDERYRILLAMLHPEELNNEGKRSDQDGIRGWGIYPLTMVVGQHYGEAFDAAMAVLKEMTKRFTAEFEVRHLLVADQERALATLAQWTDDPNHHVRRLVSEGSRPRLPWGLQLTQLVKDPLPTLPLLTALRDDESEYVRRSVANHLNDIAKDHPDLVAELAQDWMKEANKNREKLLRHACRTLIKQGHAGALTAFGIEVPQLKLVELRVDSNNVQFGDALVFNAELHSDSLKPQTLIIDYLLHFKKANGSLAAKVFKGTKLTLGAGESHTFSKKHAIKPITTRKYYAGEQGLSLRINGRDFNYVSFELLMDKT